MKKNWTIVSYFCPQCERKKIKQVPNVFLPSAKESIGWFHFQNVEENFQKKGKNSKAT